MAEVITLVTGDIPLNRIEALEEAYRELLHGGLPPTLEDTLLVKAAGDRVGILSLWHRRADLDALLASGEKPPARRLIRKHGGEPEVTIWGVLIRGSAVAGPDE